MLNYIKSECYHIFHSKEVYLLTAVFTILLAVFNLIHYICLALPSFTYGNTAFTYSMIDTSMGTLIYIVIVICSILEGNSMKTMKNSVAFGVDRKVIFFGRMIVQSIICTVMYLYLMGLHFFLGKLLLEDSGREASELFIRSTFVCIPMFLGVIAAYNCFAILIKNNITAAIYMVLTLTIIPSIMDVLGRQLEGIKKVSDMLIYNLAQAEFVEAADSYIRQFTWDTTDGIIRCMIAGICAIVIFSFIGIKGLQKKEIR